MSDQTLNVPSLFLVVLVTSLAIRYFFFSPQSSPTASHPPRIDPAHVEQIATMFPQVDRRSIQWDLQRNGGSVTATTERILSRGVLDPPPPSFQPQLPPVAAPSPAAAAEPPKPPQPDLITRYNLSSKLLAQKATDVAADSTSIHTPSWSSNKQERQDLLKRRREEMILKARRKMEEKDRPPAR